MHDPVKHQMKMMRKTCANHTPYAHMRMLHALMTVHEMVPKCQTMPISMPPAIKRILYGYGPRHKHLTFEKLMEQFFVASKYTTQFKLQTPFKYDLPLD